MRTARIEVYTSRYLGWLWRYIAANGSTLAESAHGYVHRADAIRGLEQVCGGFVHQIGDDYWMTRGNTRGILVRMLP